MHQESNNKKNLIVITGTPGTGKSTLAVLLEKKLGFKRIDLHDLIESNPKLSSDFNKEKDCFDLDMVIVEEEVQKIIENNKQQIFVLDSHVAHKLSSDIIKAVIVMHCSDLKELKKRLEARNYSETKVKENLDCEIFDVCKDEVDELNLPFIEFDTAKGKFDEKEALKALISFY